MLSSQSALSGLDITKCVNSLALIKKCRRSEIIVFFYSPDPDVFWMDALFSPRVLQHLLPGHTHTLQHITRT